VSHENTACSRIDECWVCLGLWKRVEHLELRLRDNTHLLARLEPRYDWMAHEIKAAMELNRKMLMPREGDSLGDEVRRPSGSPSGVERKNSPGATE